MKRLFFSGCIVFILISISCKKDSVNNVSHICNPCITDSPSVSHQQVIYITDSNWVGQGPHVLKSDFTQLLKEAGATVDEVYALQLVNEGMEFQFFPCCAISFHGGQLSGSVYTTGNEKICTLTFTDMGQGMYNGEIPNHVSYFQPILIKVWLWK
ncbi:MAG TPA: hypothetical protein VFI33_13845 [Puia sp.]|nr:hypothetical protein [Puia sp.]